MTEGNERGKNERGKKHGGKKTKKNNTCKETIITRGKKKRREKNEKKI